MKGYDWISWISFGRRNRNGDRNKCQKHYCTSIFQFFKGLWRYYFYQWCKVQKHNFVIHRHRKRHRTAGACWRSWYQSLHSCLSSKITRKLCRENSPCIPPTHINFRSTKSICHENPLIPPTLTLLHCFSASLPSLPPLLILTPNYSISPNYTMS